MKVKVINISKHALPEYKTALSEICDMIHRCDICTEMRMKAINAFKEFV